jgi:hypothetical protein
VQRDGRTPRGSIIDVSTAERKRVVRLDDTLADTPCIRRLTHPGVLIRIRVERRERVRCFSVGRVPRRVTQTALQTHCKRYRYQQSTGFHDDTPLDKLHAFVMPPGPERDAPELPSTRSFVAIVDESDAAYRMRRNAQGKSAR